MRLGHSKYETISQQKVLSWTVQGKECFKFKHTDQYSMSSAQNLKSETSSVVTLCNPWTIHSPWNSLGQNTGVGSLSLLQRIFPNQGLNPGLPHCRWIPYQLSYQGGPKPKLTNKKSCKLSHSFHITQNDIKMDHLSEHISKITKYHLTSTLNLSELNDSLFRLFGMLFFPYVKISWKTQLSATKQVNNINKLQVLNSEHWVISFKGTSYHHVSTTTRLTRRQQGRPGTPENRWAQTVQGSSQQGCKNQFRDAP